MRKIIPFSISLIFVVASVCLAQEPTPAPSPAAKAKPVMNKTAVQNKIIAMEKKLWEAWKNRDVKPFKSILWSGGVMIGDHGVENKEATIKFIAGDACAVKSYSLSDFKVTWLDSDAALLTYKGTQDATCMGTAAPPAVWASSVYVQRGGKWYAATHQETPAAN
jgi:hypothetical protein